MAASGSIRRASRLAVVLMTVSTTIVLAPTAQAAVSSEIVDDALRIHGDAAADVIDVACVAGDVKVNGVDPDTGAAPCDAIGFIFVRAGAGDDQVSLAQVDPRTAFPNFITGWLFGGPGDDRLVGSGATDVLYGHEGFDSLSGGPRGDSLFPGPDGAEVDGGTGSAFDLAIVSGGGFWRLLEDRVTHVRPGRYVIPIAEVEGVQVRGGAGHDTVATGGFRDVGGFHGRVALFGLGGADFLAGGDRADVLRGGAGTDRLRGNRGNDLVSGGLNEDSLLGNQGVDDLRGGPNIDECRGGPGPDVLSGCELGEAAP